MSKICRLFLPALFFILLVQSGFVAAQEVVTNYWEADIRKFEVADSVNPPPKNAVLFVGSSSIRMWNTLADDFPFATVLNRGFGGSEMSDLVYFARRIVIPYQPKIIVVYSGDNDIPNGKAPEKILADFENFVAIVRTALPQSAIIVLPPKPSPSRWKWEKEYRATRALLKDFCATPTLPNVTIVDVFLPMLTENGQPRHELFLGDMLHLNAAGYQLWKDKLTPVLKEKLGLMPTEEQ